MRRSSIVFVLSCFVLAGCAVTQAPIASSGAEAVSPATIGVTAPSTGSSNARERDGQRSLPSGPIDALLNEVV